MKNIFLFLFNGYSDWEISYCLPEIQKSKKYILKTFSFDGNPVQSMGGLHVTPELSFNDIDEKMIDLLILPGGTAWNEKKLDYIKPLILNVNKQKRGIAAICAATIFLALNGLLDNIEHTSNDLGHLKSIAPSYSGADLYQPDGAVRDDNIITASGISPIEFAKEIFNYIQLYDKNSVEKWYQLYKNGIWSD